MLNKRKTEGEYWTLYKELMDYEEKFLFPFFWVSLYRSSCKLYKNVQKIVQKPLYSHTQTGVTKVKILTGFR
jgi:hypothetical protein